MPHDYVHGHDATERERLADQADALVEIVHGDDLYPAGSSVLEAGCGVGAQTVTLATRNPEARFTCVDLSPRALSEARERVRRRGLRNVELREADIHALPFGADSFDHIFVCFVLEHVPRPALALSELRRVLKPGGSITVIEGDHGMTVLHPSSIAAHAAIAALIELQARLGGDSQIGRRLYPLLRSAGFDEVSVTPRPIYVDATRSDLAESFTRRTFIAMLEGVRDQAVHQRLIDADTFDAGIRALQRTAAPDGTFCYTFFKGRAAKGIYAESATERSINE